MGVEREDVAEREGGGMTDLVIEGGDQIGDRYHPREPRHWWIKELETHIQLGIDTTLQAHHSGV